MEYLCLQLIRSWKSAIPSTTNVALLNTDSTVVSQTDNGTINVVSPVRGLHKRIGTLILNMARKAELK